MLRDAKKPHLTPVARTHVDIFVEHYDQLKCWALQFTEHDHELAEDLLHDAFIQFSLSKPDLDKIQNLEGYLFIVMRNLHLSQMRRAGRTPLRTLSVVEFDSVDVSFWASDPRDRIRMRDELGAVCQYACIRKETAKAGSVLILRFFHGYYPEEIAQVVRTNRSAVEKRLQMARAEVKLYLEHPERLKFLGNGPVITERLDINHFDGDLRLELRRQIFRSRQGNCIERQDLHTLYTKDGSDSIEYRTLAHIVSCLNCLENVNSLLGLPPLASRYPLDTIGKDPGKKGGSGGGGDTGGGSGPGGQNMTNSFMRRMDAHFHHQPHELCVSVNGQLQGFQKVIAGKGELTLILDTPEAVGFIEVFSEQGLRLLMLNVEPPPTGDGKQTAHVELSSGRTVNANLSFGGVHPMLQVSYDDPELSIDPADEIPEMASFAIESPAAFRVPFENELTPKSFFGALKAWFDPARIAVAFAALIIVVFGLWFINQPPTLQRPLARVVLTDARNAEEALAPTADKALHRNYQIEEWSNGDLRSRTRVDEWQKQKASAKRTYDEQGHMVAGSWTRDDGTQQIFEQGQRLKSVPSGSPSTDSSKEVGEGDVAYIAPSASAFANLVDSHDVTSRVVVEDTATAYTFNFEDHKGETAQKGIPDRLLIASLALDRKTMLPTTETIVLQIGDEQREYRFSDIHVEQKPLSDISPAIFDPEPELTKGAIKVTKPLQIELMSVPPAVTGGDLPAANPGASLDTEVEVFKALDSINALSGEQITVTRTPNGQLKIVGIVDSPARKTEVLNALASVRNSPGVLIDVETALEAANRKKQQAPGTTGEIQVDSVTADNRQQVAIEPELRAYFSRRGVTEDRTPAEVRSFSNAVVNRAENLTRNALALKSLAERFSPAEIDRLDPKKRDEWRALLRSKAAAVSGDVRSLQSQLATLLGSQPVSVPPTVAGGDVSSVVDASQRLFGLAAACERQIGQSFSISNGGGSSAAVKSVQFWRNLAQMSAIAADIQK